MPDGLFDVTVVQWLVEIGAHLRKLLPL